MHNRLVELDVLGLPAKDGAAVGSVDVVSASVGSENESEEELMPAAEVEADVRARLPPFEPILSCVNRFKRGHENESLFGPLAV